MKIKHITSFIFIGVCLTLFPTLFFLNNLLPSPNHSQATEMLSHDRLILPSNTQDSDPNITFHKKYDIDNGYILDSEIHGEYAYLAVGMGGVNIVPVQTDPADCELYEYNTLGTVYALAISETYLYLAKGFEGIEILSMADPTNLHSIRSISMNCFISTVDIINGTLFCLESNSYLSPYHYPGRPYAQANVFISKYSIIDPLNPQHLNSVNLPEKLCAYCYHFNDFYFLSNNISGLPNTHLFQFDLVKFSENAFIDYGFIGEHFPGVLDFQIHDGCAYAIETWDDWSVSYTGLWCIDFKNETQIRTTELSRVSVNWRDSWKGLYTNIKFLPNNLVLTSGYGFQIFANNNLTVPIVDYSLNHSSYFENHQQIHYTAGSLLIFCMGNQFVRCNLDNLPNISSERIIYGDNAYFSDIASFSRSDAKYHIISYNYSALAIYQMKLQEEPTLYSILNLYGDIENYQIQNGRLFVLLNQTQVQIYDLKDVDAIKLLTTIDPVMDIYDFMLSSKYIILYHNYYQDSNHLYIYDISKISSPKNASLTVDYEISDIRVIGSHLYVESANTYHVNLAMDPPNKLDTINLPFSLQEIGFFEDLYYDSYFCKITQQSEFCTLRLFSITKSGLMEEIYSFEFKSYDYFMGGDYILDNGYLWLLSVNEHFEQKLNLYKLDDSSQQAIYSTNLIDLKAEIVSIDENHIFIKGIDGIFIYEYLPWTELHYVENIGITGFPSFLYGFLFLSTAVSLTIILQRKGKLQHTTKIK